MLRSFEFNKHCVLKIFRINGLNFQTLQFKNLLLSIEEAKYKTAPVQFYTSYLPCQVAESKFVKYTFNNLSWLFCEFVHFQIVCNYHVIDHRLHKLFPGLIN